MGRSMRHHALPVQENHCILHGKLARKSENQPNTAVAWVDTDSVSDFGPNGVGHLAPGLVT